MFKITLFVRCKQISCVACTHCGQKVWKKMIHIKNKILDDVAGRLIFEIRCNIHRWQIVLLLHEISLNYKSAVQFHLNQCSYADVSQMRIWSWICSVCAFEINEHESKISVLKCMAIVRYCWELSSLVVPGCHGEKMVGKMRKIWWLWKFKWFKCSSVSSKHFSCV